MSWLAVLLIGFAVADLAHSVRPIRFFPECLGALAVRGRLTTKLRLVVASGSRTDASSCTRSWTVTLGRMVL